MNASTIRRIALAGSAVFVMAAGTLGYSYLKPTAEQSAPIESVYMTTLDEDATGTVYTIDTESSKASFTVDEVLRGAPFTVVGTTDQVAGQIAFDPTNPSAAQLGTITINAVEAAASSKRARKRITWEVWKPGAGGTRRIARPWRPANEPGRPAFDRSSRPSTPRDPPAVRGARG